MNRSLKIVLAASSPGFHSYMAPLGYLYVSAVLKKAGHRVEIVFHTGDRDKTALALKELKPDLVVAGTSYKFHNNCPSPTIHPALEVVRTAKEGGASTLLMGPLNSVFQDLVTSEPALDGMAVGEPEEIIRSAAEALAEGGDLSDVPGLVLEREGRPRMTAPAPFPDLDSLPFPDREAVDFNNYVQDTYFGRRAADVLSSRGCPFNCTYCFGAARSKRNAFSSGPYFRAVSPVRVVEEIDLLYRRYGVRAVKFNDIEFCVSQKRVAEICEGLLKFNRPDLRWRAVTRATSVAPDLLALMHRAGCRSIYYGVETGEADLLKAMNKKVTLEEIREVVRRTWEAGIRPEASFLLGVPGETEESALRTIRFALELNPFLATFHVFVPFPGTLLEDRIKDLPRADLDQWDVYHLRANRSFCRVPTARLQELVRQAYRRFYLRPGFVLNLIKAAGDPYLLRFGLKTLVGRGERGLFNIVAGAGFKGKGGSG